MLFHEDAESPSTLVIVLEVYKKTIVVVNYLILCCMCSRLLPINTCAPRALNSEHQTPPYPLSVEWLERDLEPDPGGRVPWVNIDDMAVLFTTVLITLPTIT